MKLLIEGSPNEDTDWGRYFLVTLDEDAMADIRLRTSLFRTAAGKDSRLVEMAFQADVEVYEGGLEMARDEEGDTTTEIIAAGDLLKDGENWAVLGDQFRVPDDTPACKLGYGCMQIGPMGVFWEAGDPEGPTESQTFPIKIADLEKAYEGAEDAAE